MQRLKYSVCFLFSVLFLTACAPQAQQIASAPAAVQREKPVWAFEASDIPVDPGFRFGLLDNGMRYIVRHNETPAGTAIVRLEIAAGSLDEADDERGFAHFVEHMAFNGSRHVPEGEMVRLLERNGLAFGADTNASTGFDRTTYKLDLPRNDPALLDTALMLMRETASELTFAPEAVERERGVVLSEMRDRNDYRMRDALADNKFLHPDALYPERFPIGTEETVTAANAEKLKAFWAREYVPAHATLILIGDFDPDMAEAAIHEKFADWSAAPADPQPDAGPIDFGAGGRTMVYTDPAQANRLTATRHGPWLDEPDSIAQRQENLLRQIGYAIVNRRFERLSRQTKPPFRGAGFGTGDIFESGRSTRMIVDMIDRHWRRGVAAAVAEYRRALKFGFTEAEVAEQVARIRTQVEDNAGSADTRSHRALAHAAFDLLRDGTVPSHPRTVLERFEVFVPEITPERVLAALKREAIPLDDPLLRYRGRNPPEGGEKAIRAAWNKAMRASLSRGKAVDEASFAYTDFGPEGSVESDIHEPDLAIREVRFANGVRLNLKHTELEKDRVLVKVSIDGGDRLNTVDNPLATAMVQTLRAGGLGEHSRDELQTILAGKTVDDSVRSEDEAFVWTARTTPRDLELQLQLLAAYVTDPGYRPEGEVEYRQNINNFFARLRATPFSALSNALGGILSDGDPRFTLADVEAYRKLTFAQLEEDISERLANGTVEIGIVGDIDEQAAIALVAETFGALPPRESEFQTYGNQPARPFTGDRSRRVIHHTGADDQALLRLTWPTRDDSDPVETLKLELLERIVRLQLTDTLRENLGKTYSPGAASSPSRYWKGYGTFGIAASIDVSEVPATRAAIIETIAGLRKTPVNQDLLLRARQPMLETLDQALKSNRGWLALVDRAQTEPERIERYLKAKERLLALTAADVQAMASRYLDPAEVLEVLVLPEGTGEPAANTNSPTIMIPETAQ
ncbi:MAG: insulinase family protein [Novosphingobium sp.]|nr:insulinase family protein [Novosphingobium sp.]